MMKKLVANTMSGVLEFMLWLNLVAGAVSGYYIAGMVGSSKEVTYYSTKIVDAPNGYYIAGVILGILAGFLINVFGGGIFLLLMEIRNYVKEIAERG
jgi:hypothetical protein